MQLQLLETYVTKGSNKKKLLTFGHCQPESKSFGVVFRHFLGCFELVFGGMYFPKSA